MLCKKILRNPFAFSLLLPILSAHANEPLPFTEEYLFFDIPEVSSATRLTQKLTDTPASMTIITREQIEASAVTEVIELFRLVPGVQVAQPTKSKGAVTYHGVSTAYPNRLEVMIDGRSIYVPLLSTVVWETLGLTIDDIDYIEVVRGSNVPSQGSNAFLGAINIVTRTFSHLEGDTSLLIGTEKNRNVSSRVGIDMNNGFVNLATGYKTNEPTSRYDEALTNKYVNIEAQHSHNLIDDITFGIGFSDGVSHVGDTDEDDDVFVPRKHQSNYQHISLERATSPQDQLKLSASHYYLNLDIAKIAAEEYISRIEAVDLATATAYAESIDVDGTQLYPAGDHGMSDIYQLELQKTSLHNEALSSVLGTGYKYERAKSSALFDSSEWQDSHKGSLFGNMQWSPNSHSTFNGGAMLEFTDKIQPRLSPRVAYNYKPTANYTLRAAASRAYRMPSILESAGRINIRKNDENNNEVYDQISGHSKDLQPERVDTLELGLYGKVAQIDGQVDLRLFYEDVNGGINSYFVEADPDYPDVNNYRYISDNVMFWHAVGFEFQIEARPSQRSKVLFNYNYTELDGGYHRYNHPDNNVFFTLDEFAPRHTASILYNQGLTDSLDVSFNYYFMDAMKWFDGSQNEPTPAYQRLDMQLRKTIKLSNDYDAHLRLVAQNMFDHLYSEYAEYNVFDRRIYLEFKVLY